ncbi:TIGR04255 family protein [Enterobacter cloacae]
MSARYRKPPLSYVTARLQFSSTLPKRTSNQAGELDQAMALGDFIIKESSHLNTFEMNVNMTENNAQQPSFSMVERIGYFTRDRKFGVLFDQNSIEFRTSEYFNYENFLENLDKIKSIILEIIPAYGKVEVKETVLSYVDLIVKAEEFDYKLSDFFNSPTILPSHHYSNSNAVFFAAKNEYNELVTAKNRVFISLEELPQNALKVVPDSLIEFDNKFSMPISVSRMPNANSAETYVLLTTQAGQIHDKAFGLVNFTELFEDSHESCKRVFTKLIRADVADLVWEKESN